MPKAIQKGQLSPTLGGTLRVQSQGLGSIQANNTQYILNAEGNCVFLFGNDISHAPMGCYGFSPTDSPTGLSGAGAAVLVGSTWVNLDTINTATHDFRVHLANAQSIANSSQTTMVYDTVDEDTDSGYSTSTGIYTVAAAGFWLFTAAVNWASSSTGTRETILNSSSNGAVSNQNAAPVSGGVACALSGRFAIGDTVEAQVIQTLGAALDTGTGQNSNFRGVLVSL